MTMRSTDEMRTDVIRYGTFKEQTIDWHDIWTHRITICVVAAILMLGAYCLHWSYAHGEFETIVVVEN